MRLQRVEGKPFQCTCLMCERHFWSTEVFADLDGAPFKSYYCQGCVFKWWPDAGDGIFAYRLGGSVDSLIHAIRNAP